MRSERKRYVLLEADGPLSEEWRKTLRKFLEQRHGKVTLIPAGEGDRWVIVKTGHRSAAELRESFADASFGGAWVRTVLTSGCIGKLKRRALESGAS